MASTTTQVRKALDDISQMIVDARRSFEQAKTRIIDASNTLGLIATRFSSEFSEIDKYTVVGGAFESLAKDEKDKLTTEYTSLKASIDALIASF